MNRWKVWHSLPLRTCADNMQKQLGHSSLICDPCWDALSTFNITAIHYTRERGFLSPAPHPVNQCMIVMMHCLHATASTQPPDTTRTLGGGRETLHLSQPPRADPMPDPSRYQVYNMHPDDLCPGSVNLLWWLSNSPVLGKHGRDRDPVPLHIPQLSALCLHPLLLPCATQEHVSQSCRSSCDGEFPQERL